MYLCFALFSFCFASSRSGPKARDLTLCELSSYMTTKQSAHVAGEESVKPFLRYANKGIWISHQRVEKIQKRLVFIPHVMEGLTRSILTGQRDDKKESYHQKG